DPVQRDLRAEGVRVLDLEALDEAQALGTSDGTPSGAVSERLVAALIWDAHDGGPEDDDPASVPDGVLFKALLSDPLAVGDQGAPGMDLVDVLSPLACAMPRDALDALLQARDFPLDAPTCSP
ncbi:MAG: hypothetical protein KC620_22825, partial [Myxococcales bacterium]|nr:hypothetical protein [Myxococcales bacterium]